MDANKRQTDRQSRQTETETEYGIHGRLIHLGQRQRDRERETVTDRQTDR